MLYAGHSMTGWVVGGQETGGDTARRAACSENVPALPVRMTGSQEPSNHRVKVIIQSTHICEVLSLSSGNVWRRLGE